MKSAKHVHKNDNTTDGQQAPSSIRRLSIERHGSPGTSTSNYSNTQILDDDDDFQDAVDIDAPQFEMDLDTALEEAKLAINYFFNNKFDDARNLMQPWANTSMYHSIGACVFAFLEAILTFEQQHIQEASESLKRCLSVCNRYRRKNTITESLGKTFRRPNYDQYTETEVHAELCSAEALLLKAMLTFIEDETLSSLIKGGMKIRNCFNSYKECAVILNQRKWSSDSSKAHFESGVRMGIGSFNLMISLLPGRVIKLLEFIGFSGNKQVGLQDLIAGYNLPGIRQVLCVMQLLGYHLIVCFVLSHQEGDLDFCDEILTKQLRTYPEGAWFLFFKGRLEFMKGNLDESIKWYKKSWRSQNVWPQFHHLCFWELLWVNCLKLDWRESSLYAGFLVEGSRWSRTIYSYQKAAVLLMLQPNELSDLDRKTIDLLMKDAPGYKQRIAGKSLPMEKFICKKCDRFFAQKRNLVLPAIELMYLWNIFKVAGKHFHIADGILRIIDKKLNELLEKNKKEPYDVDNKALTLLLKGACLRYMKSPLQAIKCLEQVIAFKSEIKEDTYLIPYAIVEIGLIYAEQGQKDNAIACMEDVKKNYTGYSLESRLHFRIHAALTDLKGKTNEYINPLQD
ncbi:tetratricopeptide repeat protein 39B-like [Condylostylus longicornis]|uniref:tetratricopeptide repeat protein 39B-like n=1 Tax=Condylostylus longicornis TaxID=2530218 RepID=UPI00244DA0A9|nr:tetratricopeptide repeat protein 39B-like [Condylostylus longicornis]XP_055378469.1 tetratricopeptide repeat protein 39B-like [Condylostylus longicornis]XP_055378470.1 tetratricopeptide repeat protein 39B-like [Condylostylus longicornis]XP_055378471.1 tetratricopeptide repeat protein 39B-like [Condylostylus longicornis]XP_055378472.1 tetratricopeptide repeat protein 39B-like [Condylostylus longicornis]XP_055378474.1 tetratricopeptide repeat protein 39B-like [Condylostylus longicornis]